MRIELGLHDAPDTVANPWRFALEGPTRAAQALPLGTTITQVYDQTDGSLLILGAPGTGKTTLLLELARTRLDQAERDPSAPLPVVFHLSTWTEKRLPLATWLVQSGGNNLSAYEGPQQPTPTMNRFLEPIPSSYGDDSKR